MNCRVLSGLKMKLGRRAHTQHTQSPDFMGKVHKRVWEKTSGGRAEGRVKSGDPDSHGTVSSDFQCRHGGPPLLHPSFS